MGSMPGVMPGAAQPGQQTDFKKLFIGEKENLLITSHKWDLDDVEERLLQKYGKKQIKKGDNKSRQQSSSSPSSKKEMSVKDKIRASQQQKANSAKRR